MRSLIAGMLLLMPLVSHADAYEAKFERLKAAVLGKLHAATSDAQISAIESEFRAQRMLIAQWQKEGFTAEEAVDFARGYELKPEETAIINQAKVKGSKTVGAEVLVALRDYNYLLANQLLMAYVYAAHDEYLAAKARERLRVAPLAESPLRRAGN